MLQLPWTFLSSLRISVNIKSSGTTLWADERISVNFYRVNGVQKVLGLHYNVGISGVTGSNETKK